MPLRVEKMANEVTYRRLRGGADGEGVVAPLLLARLGEAGVQCMECSGGLNTCVAGMPAEPRPLASRPFTCPSPPPPLALQSLGGEVQRGGVAAPLVDVMFGRRAPRFASTQPAWQPLNTGLDASQRSAVTLAMAAQDVALIHGGWRVCLWCGMPARHVAAWVRGCRGSQPGTLPASRWRRQLRRLLLACRAWPGLDASGRCDVLLCAPLLRAGPPGTGKTTAVVELMCQEVARGKSVRGRVRLLLGWLLCPLPSLVPCHPWRRHLAPQPLRHAVPTGLAALRLSPAAECWPAPPPTWQWTTW